MKNFPHQVNDLGKLTAALGVAQTLIASGQPYNDDGTFGRALAHAGIYTFRNRGLSIAQNLAAEAQKPIGNQGFRTAARDIRRFLSLANFVGPGPTITATGTELLAAAGHLPLRNALWREAMLQLPLADAAGNVSHPYRILLRLVADNPGIDTFKLLLALEARDDSPVEYARISGLAQLDFQAILNSINVGEANARNAVKIIPGIAEQVRDITRQGSRTYLLGAPTATEDLVVEEGPAAEFEKTQPSPPVPVAADEIAPIPIFGVPQGPPVDLSAAHVVRQRRTVQHQRTTVSIAQSISDAGFQTYANPYDCLGFKQQRGGLLIEVKTLDGSRSDERRQSERALGQLRAYRFFNVPAAFKAPSLVELVAYSQRPSSDAIAFLRDNQIPAAWQEQGHWLAADAAGNIADFAPEALFA